MDLLPRSISTQIDGMIVNGGMCAIYLLCMAQSLHVLTDLGRSMRHSRELAKYALLILFGMTIIALDPFFSPQPFGGFALCRQHTISMELCCATLVTVIMLRVVWHWLVRCGDEYLEDDSPVWKVVRVPGRELLSIRVRTRDFDASTQGTEANS